MTTRRNGIPESRRRAQRIVKPPSELTPAEIESLRRDAEEALAQMKESFARNPLPPEYLEAGRRAQPPTPHPESGESAIAQHDPEASRN